MEHPLVASSLTSGLPLHVQLELLLPDLHIDFSRSRSGGLVFPSLSEFSTVYCDPHWDSQEIKLQWDAISYSRGLPD